MSHGIPEAFSHQPLLVYSPNLRAELHTAPVGMPWNTLCFPTRLTFFFFFCYPRCKCTYKRTVFNLQWRGGKVRDLLMCWVLSTAVRSISVAEWTCLYSHPPHPPPGTLFVREKWKIHIIHVHSSPDKDSISRHKPALHHVTRTRWRY